VILLAGADRFAEALGTRVSIVAASVACVGLSRSGKTKVRAAGIPIDAIGDHELPNARPLPPAR
jgi:hypothetical protein